MKRHSAERYGFSRRANQPTFNPAIQTWTMARLCPSLPPPSPTSSSSLSLLAECTVGNFMSRISKGCCRANRGRETRTNCILTHANCQCPHLPAYPPTPARSRSAAPSKFIALQWPSERDEWTTQRLRTGRNCHFALCQRTLNAWAAKCGMGGWGKCVGRR